MTEINYQHTDGGIQYDEVRAAGLCKKQPNGQADKDLLGEPFHYSSPGPVDCDKWRNDKLNPVDWLVFHVPRSSRRAIIGKGLDANRRDNIE